MVTVSSNDAMAVFCLAEMQAKSFHRMVFSFPVYPAFFGVAIERESPEVSRMVVRIWILITSNEDVNSQSSQDNPHEIEGSIFPAVYKIDVGFAHSDPLQGLNDAWS